MSFRFDTSESFPHLARAPIVEAVIHWRARASAAFIPEQVLAELHQRFPEYPNVGPQREIQVHARVGADGTSDHSNRVLWDGYRCASADGRYVFQFTPSGLVFSRLAPYETWELFETEARRVWGVYCELARPVEVDRLGVRFINLMELITLDGISAVLEAPIQVPQRLDLPLTEFMYQTCMDVPGHPYRVNVIQALQPPNPQSQAYGLIVDLDVFTTRPIPVDDPALPTRLAEIRSLKNRVFFRLLTKSAIARFGESAR
jgi:uncharacterized protein (TIGR04255 family)